MSGVELIAQERLEQVEKHAYTHKWDIKTNNEHQLSEMARLLLDPHGYHECDLELVPDGWGKETCRKMMVKPYKERIIIAGALIAAEIDRINNLTPSAG